MSRSDCLVRHIIEANRRFIDDSRGDVIMTANVTWFDLAGFLGVVLIVVAYLLLQLDKLPSSSLSYSLLNAAGALLISVSLLFKFNASAFLIEVFWFLISLLGLCKWFVSRKRLRIKEKTIMKSNPLSERQ
jgi:hypothetical protein